MSIPVMRACCVALSLLVLAGPAHARNVTHEDIRDAILSLVHMFRNSEDKLERHEYREKALGEQLKRSINGLEKKHRALEPLKGMITRLDERLFNVENIFLQKEEKEKAAQTKTNEVLADIQKSLKSLADAVANKTPGPSEASQAEALMKRLDQTDAKLDTLRTMVISLKSDLDKDALRAMCLETSSDVKPLERHISEAEKLLNRYELKLNEYGNSSRVQPDIVPLSEVSAADEAWHSKMSEVMEGQEKEIRKIQRLLADAESMWKDLPRLADLQRSNNHTLESVASLRTNLTMLNEKSAAQITAKFREMGDRLLATNVDIQQSLTQGNTMSERAYSDIQRSYEALRVELQTFSKNEHLMQQIVDNTEATKKRVEYGAHQVLLEVSELTRVQGNMLNRTFNERFDNIQAAIMNNQTASFNNISAKIEAEMSQVWRQIGIMYQQLTATKVTLDTLMEQTAQYVNGSATSLDDMKQKVGKITLHVAELQDNLNYLLGRLSLVTQEFSHIKNGLGEALDQAKTSLRDATKEIDIPAIEEARSTSQTTPNPKRTHT